MSDSHPETLTDPEHSDQAGVTSSPPQSGDEIKQGGKESRGKESERKGKMLFNKDNYKTGGQQVLDRFSQTIKTRQGDRDKKEKDSGHGYSNYKVNIYKVRVYTSISTNLANTNFYHFT